MQTLFVTRNGQVTPCPVRSGLLGYAQNRRVTLATPPSMPPAYVLADTKRGR